MNLRLGETTPLPHSSRDNTNQANLNSRFRSNFSLKLSRDSIHHFPPLSLCHRDRVLAVSETHAWLKPPVNQSRARSTAQSNPALFRHFLYSPCAIDKETRALPSLSFFPGGREDGGYSGVFSGLAPRLRGSLSAKGARPGGQDPSPPLGVIQGVPDFLGMN